MLTVTMTHVDAHILLDNLQRTARKRILLAIELLDLEQQRILAGDALALALQSKADMVCERMRILSLISTLSSRRSI